MCLVRMCERAVALRSGRKQGWRRFPSWEVGWRVTGKEAWDMDWGQLNPDVAGVLEFASR